jgi:hypothetical protein
MGKKGAAKSSSKKPRVIEEIYLYPKQDLTPINEGWVLIELKHLLWNYANIEFVLNTEATVDKLIRKIQSALGRVEKVFLYLGDSTQSHNKIQNYEQTLGNLFQTFGSSSKENPDKYSIYYDFLPYNPKDPVLLAI